MASQLVGSIRALGPRKGHACLIQSMSQVCERIRRLNSSDRRSGYLGLRQTTRTSLSAIWDFRDQVRLVGFQSDVTSFLAALDVFAFASRAEGFGQVVIEAMAAGKPVVTSRVPPITEIVVDGETGLLVEPDNPAGLRRRDHWFIAIRKRLQEHGETRAGTSS